MPALPHDYLHPDDIDNFHSELPDGSDDEDLSPAEIEASLDGHEVVATHVGTNSDLNVKRLLLQLPTNVVVDTQFYTEEDEDESEDGLHRVFRPIINTITSGSFPDASGSPYFRFSLLWKVALVSEKPNEIKKKQKKKKKNLADRFNQHFSKMSLDES